MNRKTPYILTTFLFFIMQSLNAISWELNLTDTPSFKLSEQLTDTCSAGIKFTMQSINPFIFYVLYKYNSHITYEQIAPFINPLSPDCCINTQIALYIANKNKHGKLKAKTIIKNNQNIHFSLESLINISEEYSIKKHMIFNADNMPEFDIALHYNKKITDKNKNITSGIGLQIQGFIKNNQDHYISINYSYPWNNAIGLQGSIIFNNDTISPTTPVVYTPTKNNFFGCPSTLALNIAIPCAIFVGSKEIELRSPNKKFNKAYAHYIMQQLDYNKELLNAKMNELKKELS